MIVLTSLALVLGAVVLFAREREIRREREAWETERQNLLDRIQHPAIRHTATVEDWEHEEPPRDLAELAQVGQVVPEFVDVGGD